MAKRNRGPNTPETGEQVPTRRHDAGSGAKETAMIAVLRNGRRPHSATR
jgi:hypothetical protein